MKDIKIFSGRANPELSTRICEYLGLPLGHITLGDFPDGEIACKIEEDIRGRDVFLIQTHRPTGQQQFDGIVDHDRKLQASQCRARNGRDALLRVCPTR